MGVTIAGGSRDGRAVSRRRVLQLSLAAGIPAVPEVAIPRPQPEDTVALTYQEYLLDQEGTDRPTRSMQAAFPGQRVVVIDGGGTLGVVRRDA